jgi:argininosuccinate lyase
VSKYVFVPLFEKSEEVVRSLRLLTAVIESLTVNEERMLSDATTSFCTTTELADTLVRKTDLTFRQAHTVVARIVRDTYEADGTALDIESNDLTSAAKEIFGVDIDLPASELSSALDPKQNVQRRAVIGGTAPESTRADLDVQDETLTEQRNWLLEAANQLDEAATMRRKREAHLV